MKHTWIKRLGILSAILVVLALLTGVLAHYYAVPAINKAVASTAKKKINGQLTWQSMELTPGLDIRINELDVKDKKGRDVLKSPQLTVNWSVCALMRSFFDDRDTLAAITSIVADKPAVQVYKDGEQGWNVSHLIIVDNSTPASRFYGRVLIHDGSVLAVPAAGSAVHVSSLNGQLRWDDAQIIHGAFTGQVEKALTRMDFNYKDSSHYDGEVTADGLPLTLIYQLGISYPESMNDIHIEQGKLFVQKGHLWNRNGTISLHASAQINNAGGRYKNYRFSGGYADFDVFNGHAGIHTLSMRVNGQAIKGRLSADWGKSTSVDGSFRGQDIDLAALLPGQSASGRVNGTVHVYGSTDKLSASGRVSGSDISVQGVHLKKGQGAFLWDGEKLTLSDFHGQLGNGSLDGTGSYAMHSGKFSVNVIAHNADIGTLARSYGVSGILSGQIQAEGTLSGGTPHLDSAYGRFSGTQIKGHGASVGAVTGSVTLFGNNLNAVINASRFTYQGMQADRISANVTKAGNIWNVISADGLSGQEAFHISGMASDRQMNLLVDAEHISLKGVSHVAGVAMSGEASLHGRITGTMKSPVYQGSIYASDGSIKGMEFTDISGSLTLDRNGARIDNLRWNTREGSHEISGMLGFNAQSSLNLKVKSQNIRAEQVLLLAGMSYPITGYVNNNMTITGTLKNPVVTGEILAWNGSVMGQLYQSIGADYSFKDGVLSISNGLGNAYGGTASVQGTVSEKAIDMHVELVDVNAGRILLNNQVDGKVTLRGQVTGSLSNPIFGGHVESRSIRIGEAYMGLVNADIDYANHVISVTNGMFKQGSGDFTWKGSINLADMDIDGHLQFTDWDMAEAAKILQIPVQNVSGIMSGAMNITGSMKHPNGDIAATISTGNLGNQPIADGKIDLSYRNGALTIRQLRIPVGTGLLAAEGATTPQGGLDIQMAAKDMNLSWVPQVLGRKDVQLNGSLTAGIKLSGTKDKPNAEISIGVDNPSYNGTGFDSMSVMGLITQGKVFIQHGLVVKGPYKATMYGTMPINAFTRGNTADAAPMNLDINLDNADLNILAMLTNAVTSAEGPIKGHVKVTGPWTDPELNGGIAISDGSLMIESMKEAVTGISGQIQLNGKSADLNLQSVLGGGTAAVTGKTSWDKGSLTSYEGTVQVHAPAIQSTYYNGALDTDLTIAEMFGKPGIKGTVSIHDATVDIPLSFESGDGSLPVNTNLDIQIGDNVKLYNSMLYDLAIKGNIKIIGPLSAPISSGRVNVLNGTIHYLSNEFNVTDGYAIWGGVPDSILPVINLAAGTKVGHYTVDMKLSGPPGAFRFELNSEPALNDSQIVTLLTVHSDPSSPDNDAVQGALFNAGLQMVFNSGVQDYLKQTIGLDYISVTSSLNEGYASDLKQNDSYYYIKIGKYLFNDFMLTVTTGINNEQNSLGFYYNLKNRLGVSAWYNSEHDKYVGADWNFNF